MSKHNAQEDGDEATISELPDLNNIPEDVYLGTMTSAYQAEGAWDVDGKSESIWDVMTHQHPDYIRGQSNADVACNSYYLYERDIEMVEELGANAYRLSISWPRILPEGDSHRVNKSAVDYYNKLIDGLLARGITPMVTMYNWDLPEKLQSIGGWTNPVMVNFFARYAKVLFKQFGDRVKWWITMDQPQMFALGYSLDEYMAPSQNSAGLGDYYVTDNVLKAHALVYHLYDSEFRDKQGGKVGITMFSNWVEPLSDTPEDKEAADRGLQFTIGLWAHPIFTEEGDYPPMVKETINNLSCLENRAESRLPELTVEDVKFLKGTADFFGVTHFRTSYVTAHDTGKPFFFQKDSGVFIPRSGHCFGEIYPKGLHKLLKWLSKEYPNFPFLVTVNGACDSGGLEDDTRVDYYMTHLAKTLTALKLDNIPIVGFVAYSLMDQFEWNGGYRDKFGLYEVDFEDPTRCRRMKKSGNVVAEVFRSRLVPERYFALTHGSDCPADCSCAGKGANNK